jgi:Domain of unknown function (DUF1877)
VGIVGSVSAIKEVKLKEFISKPDGNTKYGDDELYLDKSFWDINYVLTQYFEGDKKSQNQNIIYGYERIMDINKGDEVHHAYSDKNETQNLAQVINQYSNEEFEKYLDKALNDPKSILNSQSRDKLFKEATILMFEKLKSLYKKAAQEGLSIIYVYG